MFRRVFSVVVISVLLSGCATLMGYGQNDVPYPGNNMNKQDAMRAYARWYVEQQQRQTPAPNQMRRVPDPKRSSVISEI